MKRKVFQMKNLIDAAYESNINTVVGVYVSSDNTHFDVVVDGMIR